jgi:microcystin-dependent protein
VSAPFVAEVRIFACNFAPTGWAMCNGQLLPISQNTALFSLLGTFYGGDGKSTFALPNLQGSVPIGQGQGAGLSDYFLGQSSGTESVTLLQTEIPVHTHGVTTSGGDAGDRSPSAEKFAVGVGGASRYAPLAAPITQLAFQTVSVAGGSLPHTNMMPYLTLNFCIAMQGVFPPRG